VRGVINLCEEYRGPLRKYKELGMEQLYLPTTDHFEPTVEDLIVSARAVASTSLLNISCFISDRAQYPSLKGTRHMETVYMYTAEQDTVGVQLLYLHGSCTKIPAPTWRR